MGRARAIGVSALPLRRKLLVVLSALAGIALVIAGVTFWVTLRWDQTGRQLEEHYQRSLLLQRVRAAVFQAVKEVPDAPVIGDAQSRAQFAKAIAPAEEDLRQWQGLIHTDEEREEIARVSAALERLKSNVDEAITIAANQERAQARATVQQRLQNEDYDRFQEVTEAAVRRDRERRGDVRAAVLDVQNTAYITLAMAAFGVVSLVLLLAAYLASDLFRPLRHIEARLQDLERGNLGMRLPDAGDDEIGAINRAFNTLAATLDRRERLTGPGGPENRRTPAEGGRATAWQDTPSKVTLHALIAQLRARLETLLGPNDAGSAQRLALQEIDDLMRVVDRLAEFSFPLDLDLAPVDLKALVYEVMQRFQDVLVERAVSSEIVLDPELQHIVADRLKLREAMSETMRNALAALPPRGGLVGVRTSHVPDDHDILIEVADNGPGMTPETVGRMMTAGAVADGRPWSGLALARAIVEKHGGRLDLLSQPGQGTIVQIRLPQHREHGRPAPATHKAEI